MLHVKGKRVRAKGSKSKAIDTVDEEEEEAKQKQEGVVANRKVPT